MHKKPSITLVKNLSCEECGKIYLHKIQLYAHYRKFHGYSPEKLQEIRIKNRYVRTETAMKSLASVQKTNIERYGHPCYIGDAKIVRDCNMRKYGVDNPLKLQKFKDKVKRTNLQRYGTEWGLGSSEVQDKVVATNILMRGVERPCMDSTVVDKMRETNFKKYDGKWFPQTDAHRVALGHDGLTNDIVLVSKKYTWKDYIMPSGNRLRVQGYENFGLDLLLKTYAETDLVVRTEDITALVGKFWYMLPGESARRRYFPDIYIIPTNTIVEVKSVYTYSQQKVRNAAKRQACIDRGFNFAYIVFNPDSEIILNEVSQA